jgi:hypothetical protein
VKKIAMENLQDQMNSKKGESAKIKFTPVEPGQVAVVAVSPGEGLSRIFASLGAAAVVAGGQTMNPSVKEIVAAFENLPTDKIIILPNNKNIILAAQNAAKVSVKQISVIPTRNAPQGFAAMLRLLPEGTLEENEESMREAIMEVHTGEITTATRDVTIDDVHVEKNSVIGLLDGKLIVSTHSVEDALSDLLTKARVEDFERITLFYGEGMTLPRVNQMVDKIREQYPEHEVEVHDGGQPNYQLIIAIE